MGVGWGVGEGWKGVMGSRGWGGRERERDGGGGGRGIEEQWIMAWLKSYLMFSGAVV